MDDITKALRELPPMPTLTQALDHGRAWEVNRQLVGLRARLALAERLAAKVLTTHVANSDSLDDEIRDYLAHRAKEQQP